MKIRIPKCVCHYDGVVNGFCGDGKRLLMDQWTICGLRSDYFDIFFRGLYIQLFKRYWETNINHKAHYLIHDLSRFIFQY